MPFSSFRARRARPAIAGAPGLTWRLVGGGGWGPGSGRGTATRRHRHYPLPSDLEGRARRRIPRFAYDFLAGGTGDDHAVARNRAALDGIEIAARFGRPQQPAIVGTTLFGNAYTAPIGISPTGNDGVVWPGASRPLGATAARAGIPYILGTLASASIEEIAPLCPGRLWFQVYGFPRDDHRVTFDLIARARSAGVSVLVLAVDAPVRAARPRDQRNGLTVPFRPTVRTAVQVCRSPAWAVAALRTRVPVFANITRYVPAERGIGPTRLIDELRTALVQHGAADVAGLRALDVRHRTRWDLPL